MVDKFEHLTLVQLREELWARGLIPKRWMLNYVRKAEAIHLLNNISSKDELPASYVKTIKGRSSVHRKKVYQSRKKRKAGFGASLTKEERLKKVANMADALIFVEVEHNEEPFTSYFGSTKAKLAFVFRDSSGTTYKFTRTEVEKLSALGLYVPRGVMSNSRTKVDKPAKATKTLKDIFGN